MAEAAHKSAVNIQVQEVSASSIDVHDDNNELRILLIGKTGVGKSALGNIILGTNVFESKPSPESVTSRCQSYLCPRFGHNILVVDTPGLFDTNYSQEVILTEISKCYGLTSPGPHAIVMVRRPDRFTQEEMETIQIFNDFFGDDLFKYMIMGFTSVSSTFIEDIMTYTTNTIRIGEERRQEGTNVGDQTSMLYEVIQEIDARFLPFDISENGYSNEDQVKELLQMIDSLVKKNGGKYFTNANFPVVEICMNLHMNEIEEDDKDGKLLELDVHTSDTAGSMRRAQVRYLARENIQKEKKGILWAIRKMILLFESAYKWMRGRFKPRKRTSRRTQLRYKE